MLISPFQRITEANVDKSTDFISILKAYSCIYMCDGGAFLSYGIHAVMLPDDERKSPGECESNKDNVCPYPRKEAMHAAELERNVATLRHSGNAYLTQTGKLSKRFSSMQAACYTKLGAAEKGLSCLNIFGCWIMISKPCICSL